MSRRFVSGLFGFLALFSGAAIAQESLAPEVDPIEARQAAMRTNGAAAKLGGQMVKGEIPFDAAVAVLALRGMNSTSLAFGHYFPEGSQTGGETAAAPAIWERPDEFRTALAKFHTDVDAAIEAEPETQEEFQQVFSTVTENCSSCHEEFRLKKDN